MRRRVALALTTIAWGGAAATSAAAPTSVPPAPPAAAATGVPPAAPAAAPRDSPGPPTRASAWIARLVADTPAWRQPRAEGSPRMLAPLAKATGGPVGLLVLEARGNWLRVLLPARPNGAAAWINARRVRLARTRWRVEIDRSARTVRVLRGGRTVRRYKAVVGAPATPTPTGRFAIAELARQPDPDGFLGPFALHLTAHSDVLDDYGGGPGRVAIHGRGGESLTDPLGSARSHGCIRVDNAEVRFLARHLVAGVPVTVAS
jgi:lipoprotein-anchoring transpeptidase ErfK/SrfK